MSFDEVHERFCAGWHVPSSYTELLELDYDSAQRKRYLRSESKRHQSLTKVSGLEQSAKQEL
jgi:hypothetical protein